MAAPGPTVSTHAPDAVTASAQRARMGVVRVLRGRGQVLRPPGHRPVDDGQRLTTRPGPVGGAAARRQREPAVDRARPAAHGSHRERPDGTLLRDGPERLQVVAVEVRPREPGAADEHEPRLLRRLGCRTDRQGPRGPRARCPDEDEDDPDHGKHPEPQHPTGCRAHGIRRGSAAAGRPRHASTSSCRAMTTRAAVHDTGATAAGRPSWSTFSGKDPASVRCSPSHPQQRLGPRPVARRGPRRGEQRGLGRPADAVVLPRLPRRQAAGRTAHRRLRPLERAEDVSVDRTGPDRRDEEGDRGIRRRATEEAGVAVRPEPGAHLGAQQAGCRPRAVGEGHLTHQRQHLARAPETGQHRRRGAEGQGVLDELPVVGRRRRQRGAGVERGEQAPRAAHEQRPQRRQEVGRPVGGR